MKTFLGFLIVIASASSAFASPKAWVSCDSGKSANVINLGLNRADTPQEIRVLGAFKPGTPESEGLTTELKRSTFKTLTKMRHWEIVLMSDTSKHDSGMVSDAGFLSLDLNKKKQGMGRFSFKGNVYSLRCHGV